MAAFADVSSRGIARKSVGWSIAFSILLILIGLIALAEPLLAGVAVTTIFAWLLIFGGIAHLVFAWHVRGAGAHVWEALVGVAYIVAGIYLLMHRLQGLVALTVVIGAYLFVKGVLVLLMGSRLRPLPGSGWMIVDGLISILLAVMIWWHLPMSSVWAVGTLVGVAILFSGISRLALATSARRGYGAVV